MSTDLFLTWDQEPPGLEYVELAPLLEHAEDLTEITNRLNLTSIYDFVSASLEEQEEVRADYDEDDADEFFPLVDEAWFEPAQGIAWIDALIPALKQSKLEAREELSVILAELRAVFTAARSGRWHFTIPS